MSLPRIKHVRAFVSRGKGADYHDQGEGHWIDDHIIFKTLWGFAFHGWRGAPSRLRVWSRVGLLVLATSVIGYGNMLAA